MNPNTKTCPIFRSSRDAELTKAIYRRVPILLIESTGENPWGFRALLMFMMNTNSDKFQTRAELEEGGAKLCGNVFEAATDEIATSSTRSAAPDAFLPLYEAKMLHHFDHRWATYDGIETRNVSIEEKGDPNFQVLPRYWVDDAEVEAKLKEKWDRNWLLGFRNIARSTDERTTLVSIIPRVGVGHSAPLITLDASSQSTACFYANLTSFALDYCTRQKFGRINLTFGYFNQLPILPPSTYNAECAWARGSTLSSWISSRVLELSYTAHDLEPFARDLEYSGPSFEWNPERRFQLRCEFDAAFFHLYGLSREDAEYVLNTFPIVRRKDEAKFGEYRTSRVILEMYDAMAQSMS